MADENKFPGAGGAPGQGGAPTSKPADPPANKAPGEGAGQTTPGKGTAPQSSEPNTQPASGTREPADDHMKDHIAEVLAEAGPDPQVEIEKLNSQIAELTDRLLRAHADIENLRKRHDIEREETAKYAITKFARDIVGVSDNFQRAINAVPADAAASDTTLKSFLDGVSMTEREFLNVMERHGIKRLEPEGQPFNPHLHQAMMEQEKTDVASGTVLQVYQAGYVIEDRVLRPAMVVVAKGGPKVPKGGAESEKKVAGAGHEPTPGTASQPKEAATGAGAPQQSEGPQTGGAGGPGAGPASATHPGAANDDGIGGNGNGGPETDNQTPKPGSGQGGSAA